MKKGILAIVVCAAVFGCSLFLHAEEKGKAPVADKGAKATVVSSEKPVEHLPDEKISAQGRAARMRGRMLYKRSQIRRLEEKACAGNATLKAKIAALEQEKRMQFIAADSKLKQLYEELDVLEAELAKMPSGKRR